MRILKKMYPIFAFLASLFIFMVLFALNGIYPFGEKSISWCDMNQQTIPLLCEFKDVLSGKSDFWLSLENAGGMNFYGVYFFNLSSPFTYLIVFFDKTEIPQAVNIMVVLKLSLAAFTFAFWLKRFASGANPIIIIAISIVYGFSGYGMMYYQILSWLDTMYLFPLLLIGLDNLTKGKSPLVYILVLFACILCHFYLGYAIVLFVCLYGAGYMLICKEKRGAFAKKFVISSLLSALLSAVVIVPVFIQYLRSMRSGNIIQSIISSAFFPPIATSLPTFFCLLPLAPFIVDIVRKNEIDLYDTLFALTLIPVFIEPIAAAWQTYDYMSFPTRYGFITIALGLTLVVRALTNALSAKEPEKAKINYLKLFVSVAAVAFAFAFSLFSYRYYNAEKEVITAYTKSLWGNEESFKGLLIYYCIPLVFSGIVYLAIHYKMIHKIAVYALISLLCFTEAFFSASVYMVTPAVSDSSARYLQNYAKIFELENLIEDEDFYRVKSNAKYFDVNLVGALGYNSLSHYTSLNRESYMMTIKQLGYSSYWMETHSNGGSIFTDALLRNKYIINSGSSSGALYSTDNYYITENEILFPTAFIIEKSVGEESVVGLERWQIQEKLFTRLTGKSGLYSGIEISESSPLKAQTVGGKKSFTVTENQNTVEYVFKIDGTKAVYFDLFDNYSNALREHTYDAVSSITLSKNGYYTKKYNYPTSGNNGSLYLGTFTDSNITVNVKLNRSIQCQTLGVFTVDKEMLESAVSELIAGDFVVKKDKLSGNIIAKEGDALFTSFAYDEGYRVKINGKKATTFSVNGFLAIELSAGDNEIVVDFIPQGFYAGLIIFALGVILVAAYIIFCDKIQQFIKLDKLCVIAVFALGIMVVLAVYILPTVLNLLSYIS